jgi:hypothetical protein
MEEIFKIAPDLILNAPSLLVLSVVIGLFLNGKLLSSKVVDKTTGESHRAQCALFERILAEKNSRIQHLETQLAERDHLARVGLQFMMSSQHSQDSAAELLDTLDELLKQKERNDNDVAHAG